MENIDKYKLSNFESTVVISVFNFAVCELQLLCSLPGLSKAEGIEDILVSKSTSLQPTKSIEIKFHKERHYIEDTFINVCSSLLENNSWCTLENVVTNLRDENGEKFNILKEEAKVLQETIIALKRKLSTLTKIFSDEKKEIDIKISAMKDEIADAKFQQEVETKYTDNWECSRTNQGLMLAEMEELRLKNQLELLHYRINNEERVHTEIESFLQFAIAKLLEEIESWKMKYKDKVSEYDTELLAIREQRELQLNKLKALTDKYHYHGQKIKEYLEEKRQREEEEALQEHLNKLATRVQAWWRGVMVRRHLGPFKKKGKAKEKPKFKGKTNNKTEVSSDSTLKPKGK